MEIGASFSHRHLRSLGHDTEKAIAAFAELGLEWIRLGAYWDEIEPSEDEFRFEEMDDVMQRCDALDLKVVFTVGMKALRFPEYYLPDWVVERCGGWGRLHGFGTGEGELLGLVKRFIRRTVDRYREHDCVQVWQVENEPLDPSGEKWWRIGEDFLAREIRTVRELDRDRRIMLTFWGNELTRRNTEKDVVRQADIVGLDFYLRHPVTFLRFFTRYIGPLGTKRAIRRMVEKFERTSRFWVTELQAEPWEPDGLVTAKENPPSFLPEHLEENLAYVKDFSPEVVLLWGFEWWYHRREQGDERYWNAVQEWVRAYGS